MWSRFIGLCGATRLCSIRQITVGFAATAICGGLLVTGAAAADVPTKMPVAYGTASWAGLNWGLGIAADFDVFGSRVANATLVGAGNIVRITDATSNVDVGFVLEAHYFLFNNLPGNAVKAWCTSCGEVADGPFVALEIGNGAAVPSGNSGPITGYALGWMVGLHHPKLDSHGNDTNTGSWNLGIGLRVDPKAQVLGDGIVANQPLPVGETTIRYKTEPRLGIMLVSSFSF